MLPFALVTAVVARQSIVDYTSPALCTPVTPFPADPIFRERGTAAAATE